MLIFGFSTSYAQALAGRLIPGLLSGNGGVMKSFLTEVTTDSNRGKAFSYLSFGVSIGAILGPLIGGYLSFASDKYPSVFPPSHFNKFPSLLPADMLFLYYDVYYALLLYVHARNMPQYCDAQQVY